MAIWHFFAKLLPDARTFFFPHRTIPQVMLTAVSSFTVFAFFSGVGVYGYGQASHWISLMSLFVVFPAVLILCWPRNMGMASVQSSCWRLRMTGSRDPKDRVNRLMSRVENRRSGFSLPVAADWAFAASPQSGLA